MKLYSYSNNLQPIKSWKDKTNIVINQKNIKNKNLTCDINKTCSNSCFKPQPLKHYRKQYTNDNSNNSYSRNSVLGSLDRPGNNIVTTNLISNLDNELQELCSMQNISQNSNINILQNLDIYPSHEDKFYDISLNRIICTACNPQSLVIKSAKTVLDKQYSTSYKELLYKRCKTYNQNQQQYNVTFSGSNYINTSNCKNGTCKNTIFYSNRNYNVQGPISSSSRTTALKYKNKDIKTNKCCGFVIPKTDYNTFGKTANFNNCLQLPSTKTCKINKLKSTINLLK